MIQDGFIFGKKDFVLEANKHGRTQMAAFIAQFFLNPTRPDMAKSTKVEPKTNALDLSVHIQFGLKLIDQPIDQTNTHRGV